jgi:radical SAM superfamily enzyme YgiQ (UPF0313 family)
MDRSAPAPNHPSEADVFVLVEPFLQRDLVFQPNLGNALLMGAARRAGMDARLIQGQLSILPDLFDRDVEAIFSALAELDPQAHPNYAELRNADLGQLRQQSATLLETYYHQQPPRAFLDHRRINQYITHYLFTIQGIEDLIAAGREDQVPLIKRCAEGILSLNPDLIGFSAPYRFDALGQAIRKEIKQRSAVPIVIGGSFTPFIFPSRYAEVFAAQHMDYLIVGEGDLAFPRLVEALQNNAPPNNIPNVYYRAGDSIRGTPPEIVQELDSLPFPDFTPFDLDHYFTPERVLPIQTSRGCSWQRCAFCSHEAYAQGVYRTLSIPRVLAMIEYLKQTHHTSCFNFHDAEIPPGRLEEISAGILQTPTLQGQIIFKILARLEDGFLKPGLLEKLHAAGLRSVNWGMESANQRVINRMRKGIDVNNAGKILKASHKAGISNAVFIIWGFPGETPEERQDTLDFIHTHQNSIDIVISSPFMFSPFAPIGKHPEKWGLILREDVAWQSEDGVFTREKTLALGQKLHRQVLLGKISGRHTETLGRYIDIWPKEALIMIMNNHGWVRPDTLETLFAEQRDLQLYPLITGTLKVTEGKRSFTFYDYGKAFYFDAYFDETHAVSPLQERLIELSDGTRSLQTLHTIVQEEFNRTLSPDETADRVEDFFRTVFQNQWGLAFRVPFRPKPRQPEREIPA